MLYSISFPRTAIAYKQAIRMGYSEICFRIASGAPLQTRTSNGLVPWSHGVEGEYWTLNIVLENVRNIEYLHEKCTEYGILKKQTQNGENREYSASLNMGQDELLWENSRSACAGVTSVITRPQKSYYPDKVIINYKHPPVNDDLTSEMDHQLKWNSWR